MATSTSSAEEKRTKAYEKSKIKEQAAQLLAEDRLSDEKIAEKLDIGRTTLSEWKLQPQFAARVKAIVDAHAERAMHYGLARKEKRIQVLNDLHGKILQVIEERALDPELAKIPGGKTGIVTKMLKGIGHGDDFQIVEVYAIDTAALKEIRAIQDQVAQELGQKVEKYEHDFTSDARERLIAALDCGSNTRTAQGETQSIN
jgi:hypothetical protein